VHVPSACANCGCVYRYYGSIAIGTPPVAYDVILDSGSADLWLVDSQCSEGCNGLQAYASSSSSTFTNDSKPFSVTYGSGQASGILGQDVVQLAGFEVQNQVFGMFSPSPLLQTIQWPLLSGLCDQVSDGLLTAPVSGLMGVGWQALSSSGAKPFWQALYEDNVLDEPLMAFYLTRFQNASKAQNSEPGGVFTLGLSKAIYIQILDLIVSF
jgi:cathepsin D